MSGFVVTLSIFALTLAGALPLGLIISFGSMSKLKPLSWLTRTVVWMVRGTPLLLQLLVIYYGPGLLFDWRFARFTAVMVAFIINYACYFSEIYRGGIEGISCGQYEAGQVLGMTKTQIFFRIILLQVVKRIVPPMSNEIITLVKDTSLARIIATYEIIWRAQAYIKGAGLIWPLFFTGVYFLAFTGVLTLLFGYLERRMNYFRS